MDRNNLIKQLREIDKKTYQEIGKIFNISRQRIQQIYKNYNIKYSKKKKKAIYYLYNNKCNNCNEINNLHIHHIDKNRSNNSLENLLLVCRNCHYKLHRGQKRDIVKEKIIIKLQCYYCKNIFYVSKCRKNSSKFCSQKCMGLSRKIYDSKQEKWRNAARRHYWKYKNKNENLE